MKIDTLNFLNNLLLTHDEKLFHSYLDLITKVNLTLKFSNFLIK